MNNGAITHKEQNVPFPILLVFSIAVKYSLDLTVIAETKNMIKVKDRVMIEKKNGFICG